MSPEPQLTGLAKTFNSVTFTGRANVAKVEHRMLYVVQTHPSHLRQHMPPSF